MLTTIDSLLIAKRRTILVILVVLVALATALTAWLATRSTPQGRLPSITPDGAYHVGSLPNDQSEAALKVAVAALPVALSYDYRDLAKGLAAASGQMTPTFGAEFTSTFNKTVVPQALSQKAVANALVRGAGIISRDGNQASCVIYVNQVLVSSTTTAQRQTPLKVTQSRVLVGLALQSGHWLVDSIEPF